MVEDDQDPRNRRRHQRVDVPLLVQYRFSALEDYRTDYAINVSASGIFIETTEVRPLGTRVYVHLTTRDGHHLLRGEGRVVRPSDGGYAIELVGFDDAARAILDEIVREALERQGAEFPPPRSG